MENNYIMSNIYPFIFGSVKNKTISTGLIDKLINTINNYDKLTASELNSFNTEIESCINYIKDEFKNQISKLSIYDIINCLETVRDLLKVDNTRELIDYEVSENPPIDFNMFKIPSTSIKEKYKDDFLSLLLRKPDDPERYLWNSTYDMPKETPKEDIYMIRVLIPNEVEYTGIPKMFFISHNIKKQRSEYKKLYNQFIKERYPEMVNLYKVKYKNAPSRNISIKHFY